MLVPKLVHDNSVVNWLYDKNKMAAINKSEEAIINDSVFPLSSVLFGGFQLIFGFQTCNLTTLVNSYCHHFWATAGNCFQLRYHFFHI